MNIGLEPWEAVAMGLEVETVPQGDRWSERVEMMQVWADYLDQLRWGAS